MSFVNSCKIKIQMHKLFIIELKRMWRENVTIILLSVFLLVGLAAYVSAHHAQTIIENLSDQDNIAQLIPAPTAISIAQSFFKSSSQLAWMVAMFLICRSASIGSAKAQRDYFASCMKYAGSPIVVRTFVSLSLSASSYFLSLLLIGAMIDSAFDGFHVCRFLLIGIDQMMALMGLAMIAAAISCWINSTTAGFLSGFCMFTLITVFAALDIHWVSAVVSVLIPDTSILEMDDTLPIARTLAMVLGVILLSSVAIYFRPLRRTDTYVRPVEE